MAAMLVCTSWPRMEAEPPLGGKRPLKMDLWVQGSEKWPFMDRRGTHTLRAPAVCPGWMCKLVLHLQGREIVSQQLHVFSLLCV